MFTRDARQGARISGEQLKRVFSSQTSHVLRWMARQANIAVLHLNHHQILASPIELAAEINRFLDDWLDVTAMATAVDATLYRNRR